MIGRLAPRLFPTEAGAVFALNPARNLIEVVATWGTRPVDGSVFPPEACWAMRNGRPHVVDDTRASVLCEHLPSPPPPAYVCTPARRPGQLARRALRGERTGEARTSSSGRNHAKQRLADTVAAQLGLGLSNVQLREILRSPVHSRSSHRTVQPAVHGGDARARAPPRPAHRKSPRPAHGGHRRLQAAERRVRPRRRRRDPGRAGRPAAEEPPEGRHRLPVRRRGVRARAARCLHGERRATGGTAEGRGQANARAVQGYRPRTRHGLHRGCGLSGSRVGWRRLAQVSGHGPVRGQEGGAGPRRRWRARRRMWPARP